MALDFGTLSDDFYVNCGDDSTTQWSDGSKTAIVWVYPDGSPHTVVNRLVEKGSGFHLYIDTDGGSTWPARIRAGFSSASSNPERLAAESNTYDIIGDAWQCIAVRLKPSVAGGVDADQQVFRCNIGEHLIETASYGDRFVDTAALNDDSTGDIVIGANPGSSWSYYAGIMQRVCVYDGYLSIDEMNRLKNHPAHRSCILWQELGENGVGTQYDYSGRSNHGTVTGATVASNPQIVGSDGYPFDGPHYSRGRGRRNPFDRRVTQTRWARMRGRS